MRIRLLILLLMSGCSQSDEIAYDNALELAIACVDEQVPDDALVSPERADSVVEGCRPKFEHWTRMQIERVYSLPFDETNPKMTEAYERELGNKIELMKLRISKGSHQDFPNL